MWLATPLPRTAPPQDCRKATTARTRRWVSAATGRCSFWKMLVTCFSTPRSVRNTRAAIAEFESPSAINSSTSRSRAVSPPIGSSRPPPLPRNSPADRVVAAAPADELRHDAGIERRAAFGDAPYSRDEVSEVVHPVFEQVADPFGAFLQQLERVALLDVLGEDEHGRAWVLLAD